MDEGSQRPQYRSEAGRYVEGGGEMLVGKSPKHQFSENAAKSLPKISAETQETFLIRADLFPQCVHDTERSGRIEASLFTFHSLKKAASGSQIMRVLKYFWSVKAMQRWESFQWTPQGVLFYPLWPQSVSRSYSLVTHPLCQLSLLALHSTDFHWPPSWHSDKNNNEHDRKTLHTICCIAACTPCSVWS